MNNIKKIVTASVACIVLVGCGDTYKDDNEGVIVVPKINALKTLNRNVKFLTNSDGMSLYRFDKDTLNMSNCDAECQKIWPLFLGAESGSENIKVLEGTDHLAYRQHPLYTFVKDKAPDNILGNNIKNVWHLIYAPSGSNDTQTAFSNIEIKQTYLTDKDGRALYSFDKDDVNSSNCYDACEDAWPVFYSDNLGILPAGTTDSDFGLINRDESRAKDGEPLQQVTYKNNPLYYFTPDNKETGSVKGDWAKGVWHLIEITATKIDNIIITEPTTDIEAGKSKFQACASCHGTDGLTQAFGISIKIGELDDANKVNTLLNFMRNDGSGKNSTMVDIAKGLSEEEILNLSAYIGNL